jgi:hypothetical protein
MVLFQHSIVKCAYKKTYVWLLTQNVSSYIHRFLPPPNSLISSGCGFQARRSYLSTSRSCRMSRSSGFVVHL